MEMINNRKYEEISLERKNINMNYQAKAYQYEYALFETVTELFEAVESRSNIEPLKLHFAELSDEKKDVILEEVSKLVARDVVGHVNFPMMHICRAQMSMFPEDDGTHTFFFTDGIYGFSVHINIPGKGHPKGIEIKKTCLGHPVDGGGKANHNFYATDTDVKRAAHSSAA